MSQLTKQFQELEQKAHKYDLLKEIVTKELPLIDSHLNDIHEIVGKINPLLKESFFEGKRAPRGKNRQMAELIFSKMKENDYFFDVNILMRDLSIEENQARAVIAALLDLHPKVGKRDNGRFTEYYYQEGITE